MEQLKEFYEKNRRAVIFLITFLWVCIVLVVVHVIAFTRMSRIEIMRDMESDAKVGARIASETLTNYSVLSSQAAKELSQINELPSDEMYEVMGNYTDASQFDNAYFVTVDGHMYRVTSRRSGQEIPLLDTAWSEIRERDVDGKTNFVAGLVSDTPEDIAVVTPVVKQDKTIGYFAGSFNLTDKVFHTIENYIEIEGDLILVDNRGYVIVQDSFGNNDGLFDDIINLRTYMDGLELDDKAWIFMDKVFSTKEIGCMGFMVDHREYAGAYAHLDIMDNWTFINIMPTANFMRELVSQRQDEMALIFFNIILLFVVTIGMFIQTGIREKYLMKIAFEDTITGAWTKAYFRIEGEKLLHKEKNIRYAVATVDIVGFRYVNELFGHERGNEILRVMATQLQHYLGNKELLSRNTADNFELIIADTGSFEPRLGLISDELNEFAKGIDVSIPLKIRAGLVKVKKNSDNDLRWYIDRANAARKLVNVDSGKLVEEYNGSVRDDIRRREEIESTMESAMQHEEFKVFLQPKFDVFTGEIAGAEALVRWIKIDGSFVYPDQFIPVFEENGFVKKLDFYMLEKVCGLLEGLDGEKYKRVPVSVNQSRVLLMDPEYVDKVREIFERHNLPKGLVELELTETAFFDDQRKIIDILNELRDMGIVIDIDDFGSGYSSLNMLKNISFDILKIDREFFGDCGSQTARIILEKVVELAKSLDAECICEGVETQEQEQMLRDMGCRLAQGYYYSKPIAAEEFIKKYLLRDVVDVEAVEVEGNI